MNPTRLLEIFSLSLQYQIALPFPCRLSFLTRRNGAALYSSPRSLDSILYCNHWKHERLNVPFCYSSLVLPLQFAAVSQTFFPYFFAQGGRHNQRQLNEGFYF